MKLSKICLNITDGTHSSVNDDQNGAFYLFSCKNIKNGKIVTSNNERKINYDTFKILNKRSKLSFNDILITTVGTIGELAIINTENINFEFQRSVGIIKVNHDVILPKYVYYFLNSELAQKQINSLVRGAVQKCLFLSDIGKIEIIEKSRIEQQHIVDTIGSIDDLIENLNLVKDKFHRYISYKLKSEDKVDVELGDYIEVFDSLRKPISSLNRNTSKIYPYYGATGVLDYMDSYIFDGEYVLMAEDGSVITENETPIIQFISGKTWVGNHAHVLKAKNSLNLYSLYFILKDTNVKNAITGAVQMKINQSNMKKIIISIPKNIDTFNLTSSHVMSNIKKIDNKLLKLQKIKQAYLNKFFG